MREKYSDKMGKLVGLWVTYLILLGELGLKYGGIWVVFGWVLEMKMEAEFILGSGVVVLGANPRSV